MSAQQTEGQRAVVQPPETHRVLVVDDEPDVAAVTRLSLKGLRHRDRPVELAAVTSGADAVADMRAHPDTSVILLDVVMETREAGLEACEAIREELGNRFVRILLRTGQPGVAPERATIDAYDIDGYLPKAELTTNRLYAAVRTALKAYDELLEIGRHRQVLSLIHSSVLSLRSYDPPEVSLQRILVTALAITSAPLAVLSLDTVEAAGDARRLRLHLGEHGATPETAAAAEAAAAQVAANPSHEALRDGGAFGDGCLFPLVLHRDLGEGWLYVHRAVSDPLGLQALPLLAAHASNALYSSVAQRLLAAREGPIYDSLIV